MAQRSVQFFHLVDEDGYYFPNELPTERILEYVEDLNDEQAYWYSRTARMELLGDVYWTSDRDKTPMLILNRITRDVRLRLERQRTFRDFKLDEGENLADPAFVAFFPRNVVGIMRAGAAPGAARLAEYVNKVVPFPKPVRVDPLRMPDTVQQLQQESELITAFEFRMPGSVGQLERSGTPPFVRDVLEDTLRGVGTPKSVAVRVVLDPRGNVQEQSDRLLSTASALMSGPGGDLVEVAKVNYRRSDDGGADELDLLKQCRHDRRGRRGRGDGARLRGHSVTGPHDRARAAATRHRPRARRAAVS